VWVLSLVGPVPGCLERTAGPLSLVRRFGNFIAEPLRIYPVEAPGRHVWDPRVNSYARKQGDGAVLSTGDVTGAIAHPGHAGVVASAGRDMVGTFGIGAEREHSTPGRRTPR
jgi:hypothetical protein